MTDDRRTDIMVPMRDGIRLATDAWIPARTPAPVLLVRLPYGKDMVPEVSMVPTRQSLVDAGYAVVWQDVRGRFRSEGEGFEPFVAESTDGEDTIAWLLEQPWCDGNVGMYGPSYMGCVQWQTAITGAPGLRALAPHFAATDVFNAPWFSEGGAMSWHLVHSWSLLQSVTESIGSLEDLFARVGSNDAYLDLLPMADRPVITDTGRAAWWPKWMQHTDRDDYWAALAAAPSAGAVTAAALHIVGWFDLYANDSVNSYRLMRSSAGTAHARESQRLVIGPWDHASQSGVYPEHDFGETASATASGVEDLHVRFFDRHLRGLEDALDGDAPVRIFVMGVDAWRDEESWPLPDTDYVEYHLGGDGHAATSDGDGVLSTDAPRGNAADVFRYDPADPVPTAGGRMLVMGDPLGCGPVDQAPVEQRDDVLCFTTPPLEHDLEVTGHVSLVLNVSSSALDTDFTGKLVDVHPDGRALYLTDGILRMRYRTALDRPEPLTPGEVYEVRIDLAVTSNVFRAGHRIRLEVSSSNYPRYDRNSNTGGHIATETGFVVAENTVLHGPANPSRLILPVIRRG